MWNNLLLKWKVQRTAKKVQRDIIKRLTNPKKPFYSSDLYHVYSGLREQGASYFVSPVIQDRHVEVTLENNQIDWYSFRIKYCVPDMDVIVKIAIRADNTDDIIIVTVESITEPNKKAFNRKIKERTFEFENAIDYKNLRSDYKTPNTEEFVKVIKKILAMSFEVIFDYIL